MKKFYPGDKIRIISLEELEKYYSTEEFPEWMDIKYEKETIRSVIKNYSKVLTIHSNFYMFGEIEQKDLYFLREVDSRYGFWWENFLIPVHNKIKFNERIKSRR